jgi:N-acetylmuramic acid 6-phosphate etherase
VTAVLGVDLGKTGCRAAVWRGGEVAGYAEGPGAPGLADPRGVDAAERAVLAVAGEALQQAGTPVDAACVGTPGALAAPEAAHELARRLAVGLGVPRIAVTSDAITSHAGALAGGPGVVLAAGTGAVALAAGPDGQWRVVDGCGGWLGDEGSGAQIGMEALRAVLRATDGRGPDTALRAAAQARFGRLADLPRTVAGAANPGQLAATFAPDVAEHAAAGDPVAAAIVAAAAGALAGTALAAVRALPGSPPVAVVGGLTQLGPVLLDPLHAALAEAGAQVVAAAGSALDGARLLAVRTDTALEAQVVRLAATPRAQPEPEAATPAELDLLPTEGVRPGLDDLEARPAADVVRLLVDAEADAQRALSDAVPELVAAVEAVAARMAAGGRLIYAGAGTPGRLAQLDAAECVPTFGVPEGLVVGVLAGGTAALTRTVDGAEDRAEDAVAELRALALTPADTVVGITASGRTPFVLGAVGYARAAGALTVGITNNPGTELAAAVDLPVAILTGPEVLAGSTRLTAGTTEKIALNVLSTAVMISLGKTYRARMVDVQASNAKLRRRALRMVRDITGAAEPDAQRALAEAGGQAKTAVVALLAGVDAATARQRLDAAGGRVAAALEPGAAR